MRTSIRYWLCAAAVSLAVVAPEAWEAYALQEALAVEREAECPEVRVTCSCEVESVEEESGIDPPAGARVGRRHWE